MNPSDTSACKAKLLSYAPKIRMVPGFTPPIVVRLSISKPPPGLPLIAATSSIIGCPSSPHIAFPLGSLCTTTCLNVFEDVIKNSSEYIAPNGSTAVPISG